MDLYKKLLDRGAQRSSAESTATKMLEEILAEEAGYLYEGGAEKAHKISQEIDNNISTLRYMLSKHTEVVAQLGELLDSGEIVIVSDETRNAVEAYKGILQATKDVMGEDNMTEELIKAACEAGSFIAWRSIMGGKFPEENVKGKRF